jgi:hypothetical protein
VQWQTDLVVSLLRSPSWPTGRRRARRSTRR